MFYLLYGLFCGSVGSCRQLLEVFLSGGPLVLLQLFYVDPGFLQPLAYVRDIGHISSQGSLFFCLRKNLFMKSQALGTPEHQFVVSRLMNKASQLSGPQSIATLRQFHFRSHH